MLTNIIFPSRCNTRVAFGLYRCGLSEWGSQVMRVFRSYDSVTFLSVLLDVNNTRSHSKWARHCRSKYFVIIFVCPDSQGRWTRRVIDLNFLHGTMDGPLMCSHLKLFFHKLFFRLWQKYTVGVILHFSFIVTLSYRHDKLVRTRYTIDIITRYVYV